MLISVQEMRRAKLRFGLLGGAVGLLVFLILFQQTLLGSLLESFTGGLERQSAQVLVYGAEARRSVAASVVPPGTVEAVAAVDGVEQAVPFGEATVTADAGGEQVDTSLFGFVPGAAGTPTALVEGRLPERAGEGVASSEDAGDGFGLGDEITIVPGDVTVQIVGLTERSRFSVSPTVWVTWEGFEQIRLAGNPDAPAVFPSLVAVTAEDGVEPGSLTGAIDAAVPGVEALTRADAVAEAPGVAQVRTSFYLILALAYAVVGLVLAFFFLIVTVQKASTLALLRAVGAPTSRLVRALYVQVAAIILAGLVVGTLLLFAGVSAVSGVLPVTVTAGSVGFTAGVVVVVALVGSLLAVVRIVRVDPADALTRPSLGGLA